MNPEKNVPLKFKKIGMGLKLWTLSCFVIGYFSVQSQVLLNGIQQKVDDEISFWWNPDAFRVHVLSQQFDLPRYERLEIGITLPQELEEGVRAFVTQNTQTKYEKINPYLEWEIDVEAIFTNQRDTTQTFVVDGFYMEKFQSYMKNPLPFPKNGMYYTDQEYSKLGGWRILNHTYPFHVRFAPPSAGRWNFRIKITRNQREYWSDVQEFTVVESGKSGYVEVAANKRFLKLGDQPFYPVGVNAPWPETHEVFDSAMFAYHTIPQGDQTYFRPELYRPTVCVPRAYEKYQDVLKQLAAGGANYVRTIMNPISTEIEWEELGNYTKRLPQAQEMDEILELAEELGLYIHWDLAIHNTFKYNVYNIVFWDWIDNDGTPSYAYKKALKLEHPIDFFTNEEAKKYYKQRLRYIVSRWGYSTNIATFELMSEISNIGSMGDNNNEYYHQHVAAYQAWQFEMGAYLKSLYLGKIHLLTASYSGEMSKEDSTFFGSSDFDWMTSNIYDFGAPDFSGFFTKFISKRMLNESQTALADNPYTMRNRSKARGNEFELNIKPLAFAESDPIEAVKNCTNSPVEINRAQWQSLFSGLSTAISWMGWFFPKEYAIYGQMQQWISNVDLSQGNWHPGASKLIESDSSMRWVYEASYAQSMNFQQGKADLAYLRSGDLTQAIGVITNKTYNIYNADTCLILPTEIAHLAKRTAVDVSSEKLKVKGLQKGSYRITYYLPSNQVEPIFESIQKGREVRLDLPLISATKEGYVILFKITPIDG